MKYPHSRNILVISIVLHSRFLAFVILDRFGLIEKGFKMMDLHHHRGIHARHEERIRRVQNLLDVHRPTVLLLTRAPSGSEKTENAIRNVCRDTNICVSLGNVSGASRLLLGRRRGRVSYALAHYLVSGFVPELSHHLSVSLTGQRTRHHTWSALAIAIAWLVQHRPRLAFSMAHSSAFNGNTLAATIARIDRSLHYPKPN